jgi:hypothetical protein
LPTIDGKRQADLKVRLYGKLGVNDVRDVEAGL